MKRRLIVYATTFAASCMELVLIESKGMIVSALLSIFNLLVFGTLANAAVDLICSIIQSARLATEKKRTLKTIRVHAKVVRIYETIDEIRQEKGFSFFNTYVRDVKGGGSRTVVVFEDDDGERYSFIDTDVALILGDFVILTLNVFSKNGELVYGLKMLNLAKD